MTGYGDRKIIVGNVLCGESRQLSLSAKLLIRVAAELALSGQMNISELDSEALEGEAA